MNLPPITARGFVRGVRSEFVRYVYKALDAVHTSPVRASVGTGRERLRELFGPRVASFDRVGAATRLLTAVAPRSGAAIQSWLHRAERLPMAVGEATRLGFGSGSTCFLLPGPPPRVLKVFRASLGQSLPIVLTHGRKLREDQVTLRRWYARVPSILPRTQVVVLHSPLRGAPAVARIQEYVPAHARDLVHGISSTALVDALGRSSVLRDQLREFVSATRRALDREGRFLDLVGPRNVLVLQRCGEAELRIVDFGIMAIEGPTRPDDHVLAKAESILARLEAGVAAVDSSRCAARLSPVD